MKKIMVTQSSIAPIEEYTEEIKSIWKSKWMTNMGEKHEFLQTQLENYLSVDNVMLCTNGHSALEVAIQALNLSGEIITTPFTFISTTNAIIRSGCTPVFCDVDPITYTIDVNKIESLITEKTSAILPVHVYGQVCDVEGIQKIADKYNLMVLYDAAHAFAVRYKGRGIAEFGNASIFSFHATKVFNTIEGGAICFSDKILKDKINCIRDFGIRDSENIQFVGTNAKMNEFSAAMGLCNLRHVDEEIEKRKKVYERYINNLGDICGLKLPFHQQNVIMNYAYLPIIIDETKFGQSRDELCETLADKNIYARKYFYPLTNQYECVLAHCSKGNTPIADYLSKRVVTLPMFADLNIDDVDYICKLVKKI